MTHGLPGRTESKLRARARVLDEIRTTIAAEFRPPR